MTRLLDRMEQRSRETREGYGPHRPLHGYLGAMAAYAGSCLALLGVGRVAGSRLPDRIELADLSLIAVATQRCPGCWPRTR